MHQAILTPEQTTLLSTIKRFSSDFYLVGGTALALQYGHRRSIDFDLFSPNLFKNHEIKRMLKQNHNIDNTRIESVGEYTIIVDTIKMTFFQFEYPITHNLWLDTTISMPDDLTIGAMKAFAMGQRSKWKDYADLYFIFQRHSLDEVIIKAEELFGIGEFNSRLFREQLAYHQDINYHEIIEWMPGFETSKETILGKLIEISTT